MHFMSQTKSPGDGMWGAAPPGDFATALDEGRCPARRSLLAAPQGAMRFVY